MSANALDNALVLLAQASTALERTAKPGVDDVEEAKEKTKRAAKILEAAHVLMSVGVYTVADEPDRFVDQNSYQIAIPEVPAELVAEPVPFPGILAEFDTWSEEDQLNEFERRLEDLRVSLEHPDEQNLEQWDAAWEADRKLAFTRLLIAEAREPRTFKVPDDEEVATWRAQFVEVEEVPALAEQPEHMQHWLAWDAEEQLREFEALLSKLEDAGVEGGKKRKDWKKAVRPWQDLFIADREKAWRLLWIAYHERKEPVSWDIPADPSEPASVEQAEGIPGDVDPFEEGGAQ